MLYNYYKFYSNPALSIVSPIENASPCVLSIPVSPASPDNYKSYYGA